MDAMNKTTAERVRDQLAIQFGIEPEERAAKLADNMALIDDLGCDSLDCVEIVIRAEEEFGIEITDDEAEQILTVGDFIKFVER